MAGRERRMPRRGFSLAVLIVNQLLAGLGVATGIAVAAILTADLTGVLAMGGLAQSSSVLGAAIVAVPLARLAVRSGRNVALATGYGLASLGAVLVIVAAATAMAPLVFLGLAAFGAGAAAGEKSSAIFDLSHARSTSGAGGGAKCDRSEHGRYVRHDRAPANRPRDRSGVLLGLPSNAVKIVGPVVDVQCGGWSGPRYGPLESSYFPP